jgi:hypothetical protein
MRWLRLRRKGPPCFGFVRILAHINSVGQYITLMSTLAILLQMKKYLHLMCLVCLELKKEPLTSSRMVDWLSWKRMFCSMEYPWASIKYLVWRIEDRAWSAPMSSDSVELLELILCLFEKLMAAPLPSDNIALVWPWQSSWTAWEASTHHQRHVRLTVVRLSFM